jgi:hypothetical protein
MSEDHEELVHLPDAEEIEQVVELADEQLPIMPDPSKPVNQWRLLKLIEQTERKTWALGDMCRYFSIEDRQDYRIWKPLNQLLRGSRITRAMGVDSIGNASSVFTVKINAKRRSRRIEREVGPTGSPDSGPH